jgi:hypothetical protein
VVLDDLQWAGLPSLLLLDFVARRIRVAAVLVVGTYRDPEVAPEDPVAELVADVGRGGTVLPLAALSEREVGQVMAGILGTEPEPALAADVRRRTGGNPFFVQQVTRLLLAQVGSPERLGAGVAAGIPLGGPRGRRAAAGPPRRRLRRGVDRSRRDRAGVLRPPARYRRRPAREHREGPAGGGRVGAHPGRAGGADGALAVRQ